MLLGPALKKYTGESSMLYGATMMRTRGREIMNRLRQKTASMEMEENAREIMEGKLASTVGSFPVLGVWTSETGRDMLRRLRGTCEADIAGINNASFDGVWEFDGNRSDSPDAQLVALGVPWWKRIIARRANPVVKISMADGEESSAATWNQSITFPMIGSFYELNEALPLDKSEQEIKLHGYKVKQWTYAESKPEGKEIVTETLVDGRHKGEIRRKLIEGGKTYFVTSTIRMDDGNVVEKKSYFSRRREE